MTERAIELLNLPEGKCGLILDIGCGSGISGEVISEYGHYWVGMDISEAMLSVAREDESGGDLFLQDAGQGMGFRPGSFDGAVSISCLQWLCNADYKHQNPKRRLLRFFTTLYSALSHGSRAIFQFYPENADQTAMLTNCAMQAGFTGGLVVDYPNSTKRKKYFLCLVAGSAITSMPKGLTEESNVGQRSTVLVEQRQRQRGKSHQRSSVKDREWVKRKKESRRKKGETVPMDTKYTARKRRTRF